MSGQYTGADGGGGSLIGSRMFWAGYGAVLAAMGSGVPFWDWPPRISDVVVLVLNVAVFGFLAQPYLGRPVVTAMRAYRLAVVHRNTLLVGLFCVLVAVKEPPAWAAGVDAVLLAGYLLLLDVVHIPAATLRRLLSPALLLGVAVLIGGSTALVSLPASDAAYRPILAACAAGAALAAAVATGFGRGSGRRVGSRGTGTGTADRQDHQNSDRAPR
ncbi:MAG: hypothetical protein HOW97_43630 [Catenulispora sp.]|nr:hypothetical protein [Catenulispora sp.]